VVYLSAEQTYLQSINIVLDVLCGCFKCSQLKVCTSQNSS